MSLNPVASNANGSSHLHTVSEGGVELNSHIQDTEPIVNVHTENQHERHWFKNNYNGS